MTEELFKQGMELPASGYPVSEQSLADWYRKRYAREPSERELGALMAAMAERDETPPNEGPVADLEGWRTTPSAPPATRR